MTPEIQNLRGRLGPKAELRQHAELFVELLAFCDRCA
jgi:hypothetical protein